MAYILRRIFLTLPVLLGVSTLTFFLIHLIPGDPVEIMIGERANSADKAALRAQLGLDQPLPEQYLGFLKGVARFDFGTSLLSKKPVRTEIFERLPATAELTIFSIAFAVIVGIPLGVLSAIRKSKFTDKFIFTSSLFGMSIPGFWLGPMLILVFAIQLDWLPVSERGGIEHVILPALSLGIALSSILIRMTRVSMLEVIEEDYIRTAKAKGLGPRQIYFRHALRNALMPIITILGVQFGALLTGTVITETIFDWPGLGTLLFEAIQQRNYPLVQGCVLFISATYVLVNLLTDLAYAYANPRVKIA